MRTYAFTYGLTYARTYVSPYVPPYGKTYQVLLGLLCGELFVVGKQQLLALPDGSELSRRTKRLIHLTVERVVGFHESWIHCQRVVVFSQRAFWVQCAGIEHLLACLNNALPCFLVELWHGERVPRQS